jgi:hypothetical protein
MKRINRILPYIAIAVSLASITASLQSFDLGSLFTIDWGILGWMSLALVVFAIFCVIMTCYLMMQSHRILNVYISYPFYGEKEVSKLKDALSGENILTSSELSAGSDVKEVKKMIARSHVCFLAVGKTMPSMQKEEYKMMKKQGKHVYFVSIDNHGEVPSSMNGRIPLYINDEHLHEKIEEILKDSKIM